MHKNQVDVTMDDHLRGMHTTLTTSIVSPTPAFESVSEESQTNIQILLASQSPASPGLANGNVMMVERSNESTVNGVVIGLLSSFGSAIFIAIIFLIVYFFRYTNSGRILLDRIGRPGEYDDEQQYAREEAEALEEMDDLQRVEYLRAKCMQTITSSWLPLYPLESPFTYLSFHSLHTSEPARFLTNRYIIITVFSDSRERCISMGI